MFLNAELVTIEYARHHYFEEKIAVLISGVSLLSPNSDSRNLEKV